jgi:putative tryptophan/tyrosine transport system substrate-binding protein
MFGMRRREFITLVGSAAATWPLAARAQQGERIRRITVLMGVAEDALNKGNLAALLTRLDELGWKDGHNLRTDVRWWAGGPEQMQSVVADMLSSSPDVAIAATNTALAVLKPVSVIRSAPDSLPVSRIPAAISPDSRLTMVRWGAGGWTY